MNVLAPRQLPSSTFYCTLSRDFGHFQSGFRQAPIKFSFAGSGKSRDGDVVIEKNRKKPLLEILDFFGNPVTCTGARYTDEHEFYALTNVTF
jgi:hypothetical protein